MLGLSETPRPYQRYMNLVGLTWIYIRITGTDHDELLGIDGLS